MPPKPGSKKPGTRAARGITRANPAKPVVVVTKRTPARTPRNVAAAQSTGGGAHVVVHVGQSARSGSRSGARSGAASKSKTAGSKATSRVTASAPKPRAPRVRKPVFSDQQERTIGRKIRKGVQQEVPEIVRKVGKEAVAVTKFVVKKELDKEKRRARAKSKVAPAAPPAPAPAAKPARRKAKPKAPAPAPALVPPALPTAPTQPGLEEGVFSRLPPGQVARRIPQTAADLAMERAIAARNQLHGPSGVRFEKFERRKARIDARISNQKEKLERLRIKKARAEAGKLYAKSRMWGLRQAWTKFWTKRAERLDARIARKMDRINGLIALSAQVQAEYEQKRTEYVRRYSTPREVGRGAFAREQQFMEQTLAQQHTRFARDMGSLKQNRLAYLELTNQEPQASVRINRVEANIRRISTPPQAITFEIYYRQLMQAIRQGNYREALGWLAELDKLTQ